MTVGERILAAAGRELGVREIPDGSNRGPRVEFYQSLDWLNGGGYAWCVDFAWCYVVWHEVIKKPNPYPTASVAQLETWARRNGWQVSTGQPGDLACLGGRHVTIAKSFNRTAGTFEGRGGNQANMVRDSVYRIRDVTTWVRVPARLVVVAPPARAPLFEVVRGEGERAKVVFRSRNVNAVTRRAGKLLRAGARVVRVRRRKP